MGNNNNALYGAGINAAGGVIGNVVNAFGTAAANSRQWKHQKELYRWQRQDALADWTMQNEYNHPSAQMARLRSAGLNPNLVYGNGAEGNSPSPVRSSSPPGGQVHAPQVDTSFIGDSVRSYFDIKTRELEWNNLKKQNDVLTEEVNNKAVARWLMQVKGKKDMTDTELKEFDLGLKNDLRKYSLEYGELRNRKLEADIGFTLNQKELNTAMNAANLSMALTKVALMKAQTENIKMSRQEIFARTFDLINSGMLKNLEYKWQTTKGTSIHDKMWERYFGAAIGVILKKITGKGLDDILEEMK